MSYSVKATSVGIEAAHENRETSPSGDNTGGDVAILSTQASQCVTGATIQTMVTNPSRPLHCDFHTSTHVVMMAAVGDPTVDPPVSSVHLRPVAGSVVSPLRYTILMPAENARGSDCKEGAMKGIQSIDRTPSFGIPRVTMTCRSPKPLRDITV